MRLIDADALTDELIKGIEADTDKSIQTSFTKSVCMILCKAIEQQPTIDAEPVRHGKWVPKTIIIGGRDHVSGMKCSVCGEDPLNAEGDEFLTDYCPNCGAYMKGTEDD